MISKCIQTPLFTSCNNLACCYYLVKLCVCLCVSGDTWASIFMSERCSQVSLHVYSHDQNELEELEVGCGVQYFCVFVYFYL